MRRRHHMPFGATVGRGGTQFQLWAPAARQVDLLLEETAQRLPMQRRDDGWFALSAEAGAGCLYRFLIDGAKAVPDPASRFQPHDAHGPSQVVDPEAFDWDDADWRGRPWHEAVIYELHVGSFTEDGTFAGVIRELDRLVDLGITAIELMPVADFPGARNWGYDGVLPFAPDSRYGSQADLKELIAAAHRRGLMVLLDVVYNHFGPEGNYLASYVPQFFAARGTAWGDGFNFAGDGAGPVRDFFINNALYWLKEYHADGLRLDAVHAIHDDSRPHLLESLATTVRQDLVGRHVHLVVENDDNAARLLSRDTAGRPNFYDAQWNDDFHHVAHVLLTGEDDGYYGDYTQEPVAGLGKVLTEGFLYQGAFSRHRGRPRGEPSGSLPPTAFVNFLQNHDQIGNRVFGDRLETIADPETITAALAVTLLAPMVPMLFMGEEWGSKRPFPFFCDFKGGLADAVRKGRRTEYEWAYAKHGDDVPDPLDIETFKSAVLDWNARAESPGKERLALVRNLLAVRHKEIAPRLPGTVFGDAHAGADGLLTAHWTMGDGARLDLIANLSANEIAMPAAGPATRPVWGTAHAHRLSPWSVLWSLGGV